MGMTLGTIVRLVLAALILGTPTFLMGGTLPAAVRAVVAPDDVSRRAVGILYGVNTLGAVTGAVLGTFYLFESFGNHLTLWWAAAVNALVALAAFRLAKSLPQIETPTQSPIEDESAAANPRFVFVAAGLVGFAFFLMEMVWYRMLGPLLGGSTFSFGLILAGALFGIGLGGVTYALFDLKRSASLYLFALTCAAEAFFIALPYALGDRIAIAAMLLRSLGTLGFHGHVAAWSALCFVVVFPPAFVSGLQFPLLIALLGKGRRSVGSQTGAAYAWNTIGALVGSLAGGFGFIPLFSAPGVWKLVVIILSALAIVAACLPSRRPHHWFRAAIPFSISVLAVLMLSALGPTAFWRHSQIGVGRVKYFQGSPNDTRDLVQTIRRNIMWQTDGIESSVALNTANGVSFIVNGKSDGNAKVDAGTQLMCGLIGAALHPRPEKAMVIGLGTGSTAGWLASVPSMQRVDVVELETAVLKMAQVCAPVNRNALANPKLHLIIGDGRELLLTVREQYDLITSEPSNPYRAGVAGLFTREFYQSVEKRLKPGGIFLQWMQAYDVDDRTIEIFYRTLGSVFPNIESWQTQEGDLLLVASREPLVYDANFLRARLAEEPFKSALLAAWRANGLEDFLSHYVGNKTVTKIMQDLDSWPLNTDDRTVIEFAFARSVNAPNGFQLPSLRAAAHASHYDRPAITGGEIDWERVDEARPAWPAPAAHGKNSETRPAEQQRRAQAFASYLQEDWAGALRSWRAQSQEPKTVTQLLLVAESLAMTGDGAAQRYIDQLTKIVPGDAEAILAALYWKQDRKAEATESLEKFLRLAHEDPWPDQTRIKHSVALAGTIAKSQWSAEATRSLYEILRTPLCVWNADTDRMANLLLLAVHLDGKNAGVHTAAVVEGFEPNVMWERDFLELRSASYAATHNPRAAQARRDLEAFFEKEALTGDVSALKKEFERRSH